jgi:hypothetical protein
MVAALIILHASGPLIVSRRINSAANASTAGHTYSSDKWSRVATNSQLSHAEHCSAEPRISIANLTARSSSAEGEERAVRLPAWIAFAICPAKEALVLFSNHFPAR